MSSITPRPAPTKHAIVLPVPPRYAAKATAASASETHSGASEAVAATETVAATPLESNVTDPISVSTNSSAGLAQPAASAAAADASLRDVPSSTYQGILDRHNYYRSWHGAAPFTWNNWLAADAQNWANQCVFGHADTGFSQGENLWMIPDTSNPTAYLTRAADDW